MSVVLSGNDLTFSQLYDVAFRTETVSLAPAAIERMNASRAVVERLVASGATAYGINTGFGKLASVRISAEQVRQLQVNLVRSHACGVGTALSEAETRAMMLLRANAIAKGLSGVRPRLVETLCQMLNAEVHPVIPSQGSVGASGDLAPLAHLAQVVIGEGRANFHAEILPAARSDRPVHPAQRGEPQPTSGSRRRSPTGNGLAETADQPIRPLPGQMAWALPTQAAIVSLRVFAEPAPQRIPEIRPAPVQALDRQVENPGARARSSRQSSHTPADHKSRSADEHQCA